MSLYRRNISNKIERLPNVLKVSSHYCDVRTGNRHRHKMGIGVNNENNKDTIQLIQRIIKENFPESFPGINRKSDCTDFCYVEIIWVSDDNLYIDDAFRIILDRTECAIMLSNLK